MRLAKLKVKFSYDELKEFLRHYFGGLFHRLDDHHMFLLAGGLAFSLFVCVVPMTLIIFSLLGKILEGPSIAGELHKFVAQAIPYGQYADFVEQFILARVSEFKLYKNAAGIIGLVGIFFAASGLFSSMRTVLNRIYKIDDTPSAILGKLKDLGLVLLVLSYFLLSTTILPILDILGRFAERLEMLKAWRLDLLGDILVGVISFLIIFAAFYTIYYLIPQKRIPKRVIALSAFWAAVLWELAKYLFGFYISHLATLKHMYGTYTLIIVTAFWIYYTAIVFIVAAEIGQLYRERVFNRALPDL
jgi:membrane protein